MLPTAGLCTSICQCHQRNLYVNENRPVAGNREAEWLHAVTIAMCTCTGVVHNFCTFVTHMDFCWDLWVLMHWYTCKCLLNILERAVEQLAGCLTKETKVSSRGQSTTARNAELVALAYSLSKDDVTQNSHFRTSTWVKLVTPVY